MAKLTEIKLVLTNANKKVLFKKNNKNLCVKILDQVHEELYTALW
jgi:hypothetical protein